MADWRRATTLVLDSRGPLGVEREGVVPEETRQKGQGWWGGETRMRRAVL